MTNDQPLALRLADWHRAMADEPKRNEAKRQKHRQTEIELRRLHAENEALRAALRQHIRTYQVSDDHWEPEKEADRLMELVLARTGEKT